MASVALEKEIAHLKVDIMTIKELLMEKTVDFSVQVNAESGLNKNYSIKLFTQAEFDEKREEIMNRDSTKRMFLDIGRMSDAGQSELNEMYDTIANNPTSDFAAGSEKLLERWFNEASST